MILIVSHVAGFNKRFHPVKHGSKFEITFLTGYCILIIDVSLYIFVFQQEVKHLVCRILVLTRRSHRKHQVNAGIQGIL